MKKYKLIKKLPFEASPAVGYISTEKLGEAGAHYWNHNWFYPEDYPEYWEEVKEVENLEPLAFIYEGAFYTKEMDGFYHVWANPQQRNLFMAGDKTQRSIKIVYSMIVKDIIRHSKYKQLIPYYTNSVNNKL